MSLPKRALGAPSLSVLVVDDDADTRRMYSEYLRMKGWAVSTAVDGRSGIDRVIDLAPDIVVLDLAMPHVDGWTVLKQLRESSWTEALPIVVVSALTNVRDEAFHFGCDAFLTKPCSPEVLWLQIRALNRFHLNLRTGQGRPAASR